MVRWAMWLAVHYQLQLGNTGWGDAPKGMSPCVADAINHHSVRSFTFLFVWVLVWKEIGGVMGRVVQLEVVFSGATHRIALVNTACIFSLQEPQLICTPRSSDKTQKR